MLPHLVVFKMSVVKIVCLCHRKQSSVIYSLYLPQSVCVCHRQHVSVTENMCLSQTVFVCRYRQCVSVTDSIYVCHRQSVSAKKTWLNAQKRHGDCRCIRIQILLHFFSF